MVDARFAPYGIFLLRVSLGVMFVAHALLKYLVFTIPGFEGFLAKIGFPPVLAWPIVLAEVAGGVAIVLGFYGRWAAGVLLPVLLGAVVVHWPNGWLFSAPNGGWEYPAFLTAAVVAYILAGEGALAVKPARLPLLSSHPVAPQTA